MDICICIYAQEILIGLMFVVYDMLYLILYATHSVILVLVFGVGVVSIRVYTNYCITLNISQYSNFMLLSVFSPYPKFLIKINDCGMTNR